MNNMVEYKYEVNGTEVTESMVRIQTWKDYAKFADRTANANLSVDEKLFNGRLGLQTEVGEFCEYFKKHLHQGHELSLRKLELEVGDSGWYIAELLNYKGWELKEFFSDVALKKINNHIEYNVRFNNNKEILLDEIDNYRMDIKKSILSDAPMLIDVYIYGLFEKMVTLLRLYGSKMSIMELLTLNILKLRARFPDRFSVDASVNRKG